MRPLPVLLSGFFAITTSCGGDDTPAVDPGALIAVTTSGRSGVLLDDLPAAERAAAAAALLAKPATFWRQRAEMQLEAMVYRLVYRHLYYDETEGKGQLPLPPREVWNLTVQPPARVTIDGHDLVAANYTFSSNLLTSVEQAASTDPELATIGGTTEEVFVLPADPDLLLQRTGLACLNESGFPPNSIDSENARAFYDDTCTADSVGPEGCHRQPVPVGDCTQELMNEIGRIDATVHFERLPWDASVASAARVGQQLVGGPQLEALQEGLADARLIYRYFEPTACAISEGCVGAPGWRRLLQFSASVANHGDEAAGFGDVSPGGAAQQHNIIELSACHQHYHFSHYGRFSYGNDTALGSKRAFCLESTSRYLNTEDTPLTHDFSCDAQGIAPGWGDDYIAGLDCQWVDVTTVGQSADVTAPLTFEVNPDGFLCEGITQTDANGALVFEPTSFTTQSGAPVDRIACEERPDWDADNEVSADVTVPREGSFVTRGCTRSQLGYKKNCGFFEQDDLVVCDSSTIHSISCTIENGEPAQAVRICPRSIALDTGIACTYEEALAAATVDSSAPTILTFPCPSNRDLTEIGGEYSVYVAPAGDGLTAATVTCVRAI